jgi:hypothetical protein
MSFVERTKRKFIPLKRRKFGRVQGLMPVIPVTW